MSRALLVLLVLSACGDPWVPSAKNGTGCPQSFDEVCRVSAPDTSWCSPGVSCSWDRDQGRQLGVFSCDGAVRCKTYSVR